MGKLYEDVGIVKYKEIQRFDCIENDSIFLAALPDG